MGSGDGRGIGIPLKVLSREGSVEGVGGDEEEFQHLIVLPYNPAKSRYGSSLRIAFFTLLSLVITAVLFIIVKDLVEASNGWGAYPHVRTGLVNLW